MKSLNQLSSTAYRILLALWVSVTLIYGISCGTWIGKPKNPNDPKKGFITLSIHGSNSPLSLMASSVAVKSANGTSLGTLVLTDARLVLKQIRLIAESSESALTLKKDSKEDDEDEQTEEFKGPFIVDLLNNKVTPDPGEISIAAGQYRDIKLILHQIEKGGISEADPLYKRSIYVAGTFTPTQGTSRDFVLSVELSEEFSLAQLRSSNGVGIDGDSTNNIVIAFRMERWFDFSNTKINEKKLDFSSVTGASIVLSEKSEGIQKQLQEIVKKNIKSSANFGKDRDGDRRLSRDEDDE